MQGATRNLITDENSIKFDELELYSQANHCDGAGNDSGHVCFQGNIAFGEDFEDMDKREIVFKVVLAVEEITGYHFYIKNVSNPQLKQAMSFFTLCVQDRRIQMQTPEKDGRRFDRHMETLDCNGKIEGIIDKEAGGTRLKVVHTVHHDSHDYGNHTVPVLMEIRQYIKERSLQYTCNVWEELRTQSDLQTRKMIQVPIDCHLFLQIVLVFTS